MIQRFRHEINNPARVYGLDVMRAVAACLVVYEHGNFILERFSVTLSSIKIIDGVDLFFVLSGFLIGGILLRGIDQRENINFSFVKKFLVRRWFRTFPNYFLFLLINIAFIYFGIAQGFLNKYILTFFVFLQNFTKPYDFLFWESWSLTIEEWFYLLFPLLLLAGSLLIRKNKKILFLLCCLSLIAFSTIVRFYKADNHVYTYDDWDLWIRKLVICRLDGIGYGLFAAWVHFYYNKAWIKSGLFCFLTGLILFTYCALNAFETNKYFTETLYFSVSGIAGMLLLPMAEQVKRSNSSFGKCVTFISLISYAMYLCHFGVTASLIKNCFGYQTHPGLMYLFYWGFTIFLSSLVYAYYEKPLTDLRDKFS